MCNIIYIIYIICTHSNANRYQIIRSGFEICSNNTQNYRHDWEYDNPLVWNRVPFFFDNYIWHNKTYNKEGYMLWQPPTHREPGWKVVAIVTLMVALNFFRSHRPVLLGEAQGRQHAAANDGLWISCLKKTMYPSTWHFRDQMGFEHRIPPKFAG